MISLNERSKYSVLVHILHESYLHFTEVALPVFPLHYCV